MTELLLGLTIGPYLFLWDSIAKPSNSGHTAGICEGFMMIASVAMILIHLVIIAGILVTFCIFS